MYGVVAKSIVRLPRLNRLNEIRLRVIAISHKEPVRPFESSINQRLEVVPAQIFARHIYVTCIHFNNERVSLKAFLIAER